MRKRAAPAALCYDGVMHSRGGAREDQVTAELVRTLAMIGSARTAALCAEVFGVVLDPERTCARAHGTADIDLAKEVECAAVVGLSDSAVIDLTPMYNWAESRMDALITDGRSAIVLEVKLPTHASGLERSQLIRHASHARMDLDLDCISAEGTELPPGIGAASWGALDAWFETNGLSDQLATLQAMRGPVSSVVVHSEAAPLARASYPRPAQGAELSAAWDLSKVVELCRDHYGDELITERDCRLETDRMLAVYQDTGTVAPAGLRFADPIEGAMPPQRVLSIMFTPRCSRIRNAFPGSLAGFRDRTVGTGCDQHVLAALWSWAAVNAGSRSQRIRKFVPLVYNEASFAAPGLEELHELLRPAVRHH